MIEKSNMGMRPLVYVALLFLVGLGLLNAAQTQSVITTTTTRVVTISPTTYTTVITVSATTIVATIQVPGYTAIVEVYEPDQTCTITFTAQQPPSVIAIPDTTIAVPGTTLSTVINIQSYITTIIRTEGGTALTRTGLQRIPFTTMGFTVTLPAYGVFVEGCSVRTVSQIISYILDAVPATIRLSLPGFTTAFQGTTFTMPGDMPSIDLTTTYTELRRGTTYTSSTRNPGTTLTTTETITEDRTTATIVSPGTTITETYTIVITLQQQTTPAQTMTTPTVAATTTAVATQTQAPSGLSLTDVLIPAAVIVVLLAVVVFALRLRR
ncbi:MAG: hypothetical protein NYU05_01980 [Aigarchaeota archaeon]|nr:hypothetical protein [Candidatus Caldarchaeales archaeon]